MIRYYKDNLVPQELCCLLYEVVPREHHVPVRFHNRRRKDVHGEIGSYPLGSLHSTQGKQPSHIDINLNPIYNGALEACSRSAYAPSSSIWRLLLEVCLHEFGHVVTNETSLRMNRHEYHAKYGYGDVYKATERLANEWKDQRIAKILKVNPRLGQPRYISGYLGARLIKWRRAARDLPECYPFIMERRCQMTGGQLIAGDVLRELSVDPGSFTNAYALLRRASEGLGIDYVNGAGRHHKLYTWGDVPRIAERFERERLRKNKSIESLERLDEEWDFDDWSLEVIEQMEVELG